ncbi:MAG: hypothetical protein CVU66_02480 [Deltaproteobacteria bacterium HGW-Deltaproteobacteria-23]|nr:MAG: hypothetical protein CVU66_02480 [Deltaproteobacteria bacterium HGW-Deltaproteobacteria-23]
MSIYDSAFYLHRDAKTRYAAETVLSCVRELLPEINSAVDIGCGVGTWLSVLSDWGINTIQGVDGQWVETAQLVIPETAFKALDFSELNSFMLSRSFDLAICLEVAEHITADRAAEFVGALTELSDVILFSAAIPGQDGIGHVNEQWPEYWVRLFSDHDYHVYDFIRPRIWEDENIPWWYRQNILLFAGQKSQRDISSRLSQAHNLKSFGASSIVHPSLVHQLNYKISQLDNLTFISALKLLFRGDRYRRSIS